MEFLETILALIVTLSILITFHELGHFWVARWCGVKVLRFSIGFGKPLATWHMKPVAVPAPPEDQALRTRANERVGTELVIAAIPLGGYVKMLDEREGFVADDELHLAFNRQSLRARIAIVLAGPVANFLLAILCYWILFTAGVTGIVPLLGDITGTSKAGLAGLRDGQEIVAVDGRETPTWTEVNLQLFNRIGDSGDIRFRVRDKNGIESTHSVPISTWLSDEETPYPSQDLGLNFYQPAVPPVIGSLQKGGRAEAGGLEPGDRVLAIDSQPVTEWRELVEIIQRNPEKTLELSIARGDTTRLIPVTPARVEREGGEVGYVGAGAAMVDIPPELRREVSYPWYGAWVPALAKTGEMTLFTLESLKKMVLGAISTANLGGPITIARVATASARSGFESYLDFIALLSISLGVLNLLPIPILDGGHLLYFLIEGVRGRPVPERIQAIGLQVGIVIIVSIMLLAFYNDIARF